MATTTSISRRTVTIKGKNAKLPKATPSATGFSQRRDSLSYSSPTLKRPPPRRIKKWWQKSEVLFALALAGFVIGGLTYLGVTAKPAPSSYQEEYFVSGGATFGDTNGTEGRNRGNSSSQDKVTNSESFLSFARTQRLRNEASRASHAARQSAR